MYYDTHYLITRINEIHSSDGGAIAELKEVIVMIQLNQDELTGVKDLAHEKLKEAEEYSKGINKFIKDNK